MKKFKALFLTSILLILGSAIYSQPTDSLKSKKLSITTYLFDFIPSFINTSNINLGAEVYIKKRKSIGANFGYLISNGASGGYEFDAISTKGIKAQLEGKHYFNKRKIVQPAIFVFWPHIFQFKSQELQNAGYYVAANLGYQTTETKKEETVVDYITDVPYPNFTYYKTNVYSVDRNAYALNIKFGYNCIKKHGFAIDYAVGLGAQYIETKSNNRITPQHTHTGKDFFGSNLYDNDGSGIYPTVIYQLKLGYAF